MSGSYKKEIDAMPAWKAAEAVQRILDQGQIMSAVCGSLRRGLKIVGDIDIVVEEPLETALHLIARDCIRNGVRVEMLSGKKATKFATVLIDGIQFNFAVATAENWGAMIMYLTGSKQFNILIRSKAKAVGLKLNATGLWHGDTIVAGRTEQQIFQCLSLEYLEPKDRDITPGKYYHLK